jgi:hypothetical protein
VTNRIASLEEELGKLKRLLSQAADDSPSVRLMAGSLRQRMEEVHRELADALRPHLRIHLDGPSVIDHGIKLEALGPLLDELQETVSSIGQALRGSATAFSSIPMDIRQETALVLDTAVPGSVVLHVRGPAAPVAEEIELFPVDAEAQSLAITALGRLMSVARSASAMDMNEDDLVDDVYPLGPRTYKHLNDLMKIIADEELGVDFSLYSPSKEEETATISAPSARRIQEVLRRTRVAEDRDIVRGELKGVSSLRNAFEVVTPDNRVIRGRVREDLVPSLRLWYEKQILATLEVTVTISLSTGQERKKYLLIGLADAS